MKPSERLQKIEDTIADVKEYMGHIHWVEVAIDGTDVLFLINRVKKLTAALEKLDSMGTDATYDENDRWINGGFASDGSEIIKKALEDNE